MVSHRQRDGGDQTLLDAVHERVDVLADKHKLPRKRLQTVAEALLAQSCRFDAAKIEYREHEATTGFYLHSLEEALQYMNAKKALSYFESEDIAQIENRYWTYWSLSKKWPPLYPIREIGELAHLAGGHLRNQNDNLIRNGFCSGDSLKLGLLFYPLTDILFWQRQDWVQTGGSLEESTGLGKNGVEAETIPLQELMGLRKKLFTIQDSLLRVTARARSSDLDGDDLWKETVELFNAILTDTEIERLLELETGEIRVRNPTGLLLDENPIFTAQYRGGLMTILQMVGHVISELRFYLYANAYESLRGFYQDEEGYPLRRVIGSYFRMRDRPEANRLDSALDEFNTTMKNVKEFEKEFYEKASLALLDEHPVIVSGNPVPKHIVEDARKFAKDVMQYALQVYRFTNRLPAPPYFVPEAHPDILLKNRFCFDGTRWVVSFQTRLFHPPDLLGMHYIWAILHSHPKPVALDKLDLTLDRRSKSALNHLKKIGQVEAAFAQCTDDSCDYSSLHVVESVEEPVVSEEHVVEPTIRKGHGEKETIVDQVAVDAYVREIRSLETRLSLSSDPAQQSDLRKSIVSIKQALKEGAYNSSNGMRPKIFKDTHSESLRIAVYNAVVRARKSIENEIPALSENLKAIKIGICCTYESPDEMNWITTL